MIVKTLLLFVLVVNSFANPEWYYSLKKESTNLYIGYGSDTDESRAKQIALNEVASQISVKIDSKHEEESELVDGEYTLNVKEKLKQSANATFSDYRLLKSEYMDGRYFVAVEYENIPNIDKFVNKVKTNKALVDEKQNTYLSKTLMANYLKNALGKSVDFSLLRKDKKWYIKHKNTLQVLNKKEFENFFVSKANDEIELKINKKRNILHDGDSFYFKAKSVKNGFLSILTVYENGTVATLVRNVPVKKEKEQSVPDEEFESVPTAGVITEGLETFDLYVAVLSEKKLMFDSFAYADDELIEQERYKNFDALIRFLDDKTFTTLKVITKP